MGFDKSPRQIRPLVGYGQYGDEKQPTEQRH